MMFLCVVIYSTATSSRQKNGLRANTRIRVIDLRENDRSTEGGIDLEGLTVKHGG